MRLGADVEAAIVELRALAQGMVPPLLVERGLAGALREAAQRAAIPVRTEIHDVGRCAAAIETRCLFLLSRGAAECGQACRPGRHRTPDVCGATATCLPFALPTMVRALQSRGARSTGQGLVNMRERIEAVGGQLDIHELPERGFEVRGTVAATVNESAGEAAASDSMPVPMSPGRPATPAGVADEVR